MKILFVCVCVCACVCVCVCVCVGVCVIERWGGSVLYVYIGVYSKGSSRTWIESSMCLGCPEIESLDSLEYGNGCQWS